jgi:hypothetical protein
MDQNNLKPLSKRPISSKCLFVCLFTKFKRHVSKEERFFFKNLVENGTKYPKHHTSYATNYGLRISKLGEEAIKEKHKAEKLIKVSVLFVCFVLTLYRKKKGCLLLTSSKLLHQRKKQNMRGQQKKIQMMNQPGSG